MPSSARRLALCAIALCASLAAAAAHAGSFALGDDAQLQYKLTLGYGLAMRMNNPNDALINGPVDQFQSQLFPPAMPGQPAQLFRFTHTGLPTTINYDDGDRNFKAGSLINNRVSGLLELEFDWKNFGIVASGDGFYDQVYHHPNDNNSPRTLNVLGPNGEYPDPTPTRFTDATRYYDGQRVRLLDAYVFADWTLGPQTSVDLRVGQQVVGWGQSLFFSGVALAQGRADATKAFVPGAEVKSILLPTNQIALRLGVTNMLSLVGYYKLAFRATEIFPEGDYFSPADAIGPGATFVYGSANPLAGPGSCQGLLTNFRIGNTPAAATPAIENLVCNVILAPIGTASGAVPFIPATRGPDLRPSDFGQYGTGIEYQLTSRTNLAFYYLRYDDSNPSVNLNVGFAAFTTRPVVTTQIINQPVPTSYNVKYFDGIHLYSLAFSTVLGKFNVAGELNYRDGAAVPVAADISGVISPVFTRAKVSQALLSGLYVTNPRLWFDDFAFVAETGYVYVNGVNRVAPYPGVLTLGNGDQLFYNKNAWGVQALMIPTKHNVISGWDVSMPVAIGSLIKGTPSLAGSFGALYGEGDTRLGVNLNFTYLQNLSFGLGYNFFFGDPNKLIGNSLLHANPYSDRDYATFNIKYDL
jgi:hypothetical protein